MAVDPFLLEILVCPETKANVAPATPELLKRLNRAILSGGVVNRGGRRLTELLDDVLVRQDLEVAYPVRDDMPLLRIDDQIDLRAI